MMRLFTRKKNAEPKFENAIDAYESICSIDQRIIEQELKKSLAQKKEPISYGDLVKDALGFIDKKNRNLYFDAAYVSLKNIISTGAVEVTEVTEVKTYKMTTKGRIDYELSKKKEEVGSARKDEDEISIDFTSFMESLQ